MKSTYEEFKTMVQEGILALIPDNRNLEVKIHKFPKTNIVLDGLTILTKNSTFEAAPVIYLNDYYKEFQKGRKLKSILIEITGIYLKHKNKSPIQSFNFLDEDNIIISVINKDLNKELLRDTPHFVFNDLAVIFRSVLNKSKDGVGSFVLHSRLLEGIDINNLLGKAIANTKRLFPFTVTEISKIIFNMYKEEMPNYDEDFLKEITDSFPLPIYVISNSIGIYGACAIIYHDLFKDLCEDISADELIIIPSSVHELLVLDKKFPIDPDAVKEMVASVNMEVVEADEVLSNSVYIYNKSTNKVEIYK